MKQSHLELFSTLKTELKGAPVEVKIAYQSLVKHFSIETDLPPNLEKILRTTRAKIESKEINQSYDFPTKSGIPAHTAVIYYKTDKLTDEQYDSINELTDPNNELLRIKASSGGIKLVINLDKAINLGLLNHNLRK